MVQHPRAGGGVVGPEDLARAGEFVDPAGLRVVGDEVAVRAELLGVRGVGDRKLQAPDQFAGGSDFVDVGAVDLGDEDVAVGERGVAVGRAEPAGRFVGAFGGIAEGAQDPLARGDQEDSAILGVGDRDVPSASR